ncbi:hypothetical protein TKK_0002126 [Trichogramma kaykai]|uniref:Centromere/kinetochore protein zw10 homolog n=1 Tax=Trichogramma kaykai TaxID=54128 RepID=A0ABD2XAZ1_9HYME
MSSFINDLLLATESCKEEDRKDKINVIKKEISKLKDVINEFTTAKNDELEMFIVPNEKLVEECDELISNMQYLRGYIKNTVNVNLMLSVDELHKFSMDLKETNFGLSLVNHLQEIVKCFKSIENYQSVKEKPYTTAALTLNKLATLVIERNHNIKLLNVYDSIKEEYGRLYEQCTQDLNFFWKQNIFWSDAEVELQSGKSFSLSIKCSKDELADVTQALDYLHKLSRCMESLTAKLNLLIINPIINSSCQINVTDSTLKLEILDKKQVPAIEDVFENLKTFLEFLHDHFDVPLDNDESVFIKLSNLLLENFSTVLIEDCISKIIPTSTTELEKFEFFVRKIEEFQTFLLQIKFISEDHMFLSKYTMDTDKLYIDKKCEKLLESARNIMKKDLHDTFLHKPHIPSIPDAREYQESSDIKKTNLSKNTFQFPECQISKSAQEIVDLLHEILEDACQCLDKYVYRLFYTSRNIIEMYAALVPEIHKSFLETIPQQVALFHNNCIYLSHHLLLLSSKYKYRIPLQSQNFNFVYTDQSVLLRQVGTEYFLNHMKYQRDIIFGIIRESGLSSIGQMPELPVTTEKAIRQCIRQLELLKTVWIEILPVKVYCRTLGCIVNDVVEDLCMKVCSVEDISANVASELAILFDVIIKRVPQVFPDPILIQQHVQKWRKLRELIIVLGASLKEIEDRWADGKGPLANEFNAQSVKQLIRALFQNTDRRSNLLSKIKEK